MKTIRRAITALTAAALTAGLTVLGAMASEADRMPALDAGEECTLTVSMTYTDPNLEADNVKPMPGVEVKLARVAELSVNGGSADYTLLDAYADTGIELAGMTASQSNEAAAALAPLVPEADVVEAKAGSDGAAAFPNLEPGMYLVFQDAGANTAYRVDAIATFLVAVPLPVQAEAGNAWQYAVSVSPKTQLDGPANNGQVTVTKQLFNTETGLAYNPPENQTLTFYVGLFTDEACTVRAAGTADMPLAFTNSSTARATFENLETDRTYYIAETDGRGNVVPSVYLGEQVLFEAQYPDGQAVSITRQQPEGAISFNNATTGLPAGFYYGGKLTITKKTVRDGSEYNTDDVFYAGLFTDAGFRTRYGDVVELDMNGGSSSSVTLDVNIGTSESDTATFYVTETDASGRPLDASAQEFAISVDQPGGQVTLSPADPNREVTITNTFGEEESESESEQGRNSRQGGSGSDEGKEGPRTGDETPVAGYILLMAGALVLAAVLAGVLVVRRRRRG